MKLGFALLFFAIFCAAPLRADGPVKTIGLIEDVRLMPEGITITAKVDTGAENSSIDTSEWTVFERAGSQWIKFTLRLDKKHHKTLERPLGRMTRIHRAGSVQERPVVNLALCVGEVLKTVEVNLAERPKLTYRMLLGASFLSGSHLVDVAKTKTTEPNCKVAEK